MSFDPASESDVSAAVVEALRRTWPDVELAAPPRFVPAATSTWVWFVEIVGSAVPDRARGGLVLRLFGDDQASRLDRESRLCDQLVHLGYPAPGTVWRGSVGGHPAQLQTRLAGVPVMDAIAGPRIRSIVQSMGRLQADLHALPTGSFDVESLTAADYLRLDVGRRLERLTDLDDSGTWEWLVGTACSIETDERVLCHGDFHPLNAVMAPDRSIGIVDWTDACLADRHLDVGRTVALFGLAFVLAQTRAERWALWALRGRFVTWHVDAYRARAGAIVDERALAWWQVVHSYRGWVQLAELREETVASRTSSTIDSFPEDLPGRLLDRCRSLRQLTGL